MRPGPGQSLTDGELADPVCTRDYVAHTPGRTDRDRIGVEVGVFAGGHLDFAISGDDFGGVDDQTRRRGHGGHQGGHVQQKLGGVGTMLIWTLTNRRCTSATTG